MFCSTLQEQLGDIGKGDYTHGKAQNHDLSLGVRLRIRSRIVSEHRKRYPVLFHGE